MGTQSKPKQVSPLGAIKQTNKLFRKILASTSGLLLATRRKMRRVSTRNMLNLEKQRVQIVFSVAI
jgi:hypothetical protein